MYTNQILEALLSTWLW